MKPRTFKLTDEQHETAKKRARRLSLSFSEYVRHLIARDLRNSKRKRAA